MSVNEFRQPFKMSVNAGVKTERQMYDNFQQIIYLLHGTSPSTGARSNSAGDTSMHIQSATQAYSTKSLIKQQKKWIDSELVSTLYHCGSGRLCCYVLWYNGHDAGTLSSDV